MILFSLPILYLVGLYPNFALLNILGYQFAPRYKKLDSQHRRIYGFHKPQYYKDLPVKSISKIKKQPIIEEWPNIQKIILSLALKSTTQSTIVRKLSSSLERVYTVSHQLHYFLQCVSSLYPSDTKEQQGKPL